LPDQGYEEFDLGRRGPALREALYARLHERLASLPGVSAAGLGKHGAWPVKIQAAGQDQPMEVLLDGCGLGASDLFRAMQIPFRSGRTLDATDALGEGVVINETMARNLWPGEVAIGQRFGGAIRGDKKTFVVVGVVGDLRDNRFDERVRPTFYRPCHELGLTGTRTFFVVRTQGDPRPMVTTIRKGLAAEEPGMRNPEVTVMQQSLYDATQTRRAYMTYLVIFALAGLALSALEIYGVLSHAVTRRTQEIGIRMALGAERGQVLRLILAEGGRLTLWGAALGLVAAYWLGRFLQHQLFEVNPAEPAVLAGAVLLLLAVALGACGIPAHRATRLEPMEALRHE
jgi:putative ABC transport system permease protein